ncbi:aldo/keto reductase [Xylophilus sp.]|uniref:aldo/keto reductase n=1 Tax=Xylophilus sp. TaxID=2653893 RepID=UPI0013B73BA8|nr:aldo/keto reductase [Xylophilus sp.]KAF1043457.1 MAG: 2,5-diketo-D-gluconic acid reductase B [Xylophilus sp.]
MAFPTLTAHGAAIPVLGFGVFRVSGEEVERVVPAALAAGFRHFDTAQFYRNEAALGRALKDSGVPREELFITTKVWPDNYGADRFAVSVDESLERLQLDHVDLLLLHWPGDQVPIAEQIEQLNAVQRAGRTRHIGVSNQNAAQLRESVERSAAPIVTNQIELHPYLDQRAILAAAKELGVAVTAYFALADGRVPNDPVLQEIGRAHGKSAAQVALRWVLDHGHIALSKTARPERAAENAALFDFRLSPEEIARIDALARPGGRIVNPQGLAPAWDGEKDIPSAG